MYPILGLLSNVDNQPEIFLWDTKRNFNFGFFYLAIFLNKVQRIIALRYSFIHENVNQIFDLIPKKLKLSASIKEIMRLYVYLTLYIDYFNF